MQRLSQPSTGYGINHAQYREDDSVCAPFGLRSGLEPLIALFCLENPTLVRSRPVDAGINITVEIQVREEVVE